MKFRPVLGLLGAGLTIGTAHAAPDPRLVTRAYDPDAVVRIDGRPGC